MVRNFPRLFTPTDEFSPPRTETAQVEGLGERVLDRVREAFCGLHGHDSLLQFGTDRLFLKCVSCGHESPGWELKEPAPIAVPADNRRRPIVEEQLIDARRIA